MNLPADPGGASHQRATRHDPLRWPLAGGAALGLALALLGLARQDTARELPASSIAEVNGHALDVAHYQRALAAVSADRSASELDLEERRRILQRVIDEELLVQRGLQLGLASADRRLRAELAGAVIELLTTRGGQHASPSERQLRDFFAAHPDHFRRGARVAVRGRYFAPDSAARARALAARTRILAGARAETQGAPLPVPLPGDPLSAAKLRDYLGPTASQLLIALPPGGWSEPLALAGGYALLQVVTREAGQLPPYAQVQQAVLGQWQRRAGEQALADFLTRSREAGRIVIDESRL